MRNFFMLAVLLITVNYCFAQQTSEVVLTSTPEDYYNVVITILLTISEALAIIPFFKSKGILAIIINILRALKRKNS